MSKSSRTEYNDYLKESKAKRVVFAHSRVDPEIRELRNLIIGE